MTEFSRLSTSRLAEARHTERVGCGTVGYGSLGKGVGVYGNKQVCVIGIGYVGAALQGNEHVAFAGVNNLDIGAVFLAQASASQSHGEIDIFLFRKRTYGTAIVSSVSGFDYECKNTFFLVSNRILYAE